MFEVGARVVVTGGEYAGREGRVIAQGRDTYFLYLTTADGEVLTVEVPHGWLRRADIGERVAPPTDTGLH